MLKLKLKKIFMLTLCGIISMVLQNNIVLAMENSLNFKDIMKHVNYNSDSDEENENSKVVKGESGKYSIKIESTKPKINVETSSKKNNIKLNTTINSMNSINSKSIVFYPKTNTTDILVNESITNKNNNKNEKLMVEYLNNFLDNSYDDKVMFNSFSNRSVNESFDQKENNIEYKKNKKEQLDFFMSFDNEVQKLIEETWAERKNREYKNKNSNRDVKNNMELSLKSNFNKKLKENILKGFHDFTVKKFKILEMDYKNYTSQENENFSFIDDIINKKEGVALSKKEYNKEIASSENDLKKQYEEVFVKTLRMVGVDYIKKYCKEKNIGVDEVVDLIFKKSLYFKEKYKNKIYNNPQKFDWEQEKKISKYFLKEVEKKRYYDVLFDEENLFRKKFLEDNTVDGFDIVDFYVKMDKIYLIYKEKNTGIQFVVLTKSSNIGDFILVKNLNKYTQDVAERLETANRVMWEKSKFKQISINKDIYGRTDLLIIEAKDKYEDILDDIYPIIQNVYCTNSEDSILFVIKDPVDLLDFYDNSNSKDSYSSQYFKNVLISLKDNFLPTLSKDLFDVEYENVRKFDKQTGNLDYDGDVCKFFDFDVLYNDDISFYKNKVCKLDRNQPINCGVELAKNVVVVEMPYKGLACDKDIIDFPYTLIPLEVVKKISKKLFHNKDIAYKNVSYDKYDVEWLDFIPLKFYCDKTVDSSDIFNMLFDYYNILKFKLNNMQQKYDSKDYEFFKFNRLLYKHLNLFNSNLLDDILKNKYNGTDKASLLIEYGKVFLMEKIIERLDFSEDYRKCIPIIKLIEKSFIKDSVPFSKRYFDIVDDHYIEDYLLRIFENVDNGFVEFKKFFDYLDKNRFNEIVRVYRKST